MVLRYPLSGALDTAMWVSLAVCPNEKAMTLLRLCITLKGTVIDKRGRRPRDPVGEPSAARLGVRQSYAALSSTRGYSAVSVGQPGKSGMGLPHSKARRAR